MFENPRESRHEWEKPGESAAIPVSKRTTEELTTAQKEVARLLDSLSGQGWQRVGSNIWATWFELEDGTSFVQILAISLSEIRLTSGATAVLTGERQEPKPTKRPARRRAKKSATGRTASDTAGR